MLDLKTVSVKVENYKCFGEGEHGFETILPINLIIGRNNSGKSTLLDLIGLSATPMHVKHLAHKGRTVKLTFSVPIDRKTIIDSVPANVGGGPIDGNHLEHALRWTGDLIRWRYTPEANRRELVGIEPAMGDWAQSYVTQIFQRTQNPLEQYRFVRLLADRNIQPEAEALPPEVTPNGNGFTNAVNQFINHSSLPSQLVEHDLLVALNRVFEPDVAFTRILVQKLNNGQWEVYLEESEKGRIPLSQSGSGLKTVLLVLGLIHFTPVLEQRHLREFLFGFEELENNLHPALQRRLFLYLRELAVEQGCHFFITTHSNVVIDLFAHDTEAQIVHVTHTGIESTARRVTTYIDNCGVLDDLDVRASDLLQSNGLVWLEGPSDRLYFNRWLDLWTGGALKEGAHYQCVYYGGRLLSHLSAEAPQIEAAEVLQILRVNRNALIMIDSDKRHRNATLNATKKRIISEIERIGGMAWVTAGREVENYLPVGALRSLYENATIAATDRYSEFSTVLDSIKEHEGKRFLRNKVLFAERIIPHIVLEDLVQQLDLKARLISAVEQIQRWNALPIRVVPHAQQSV
jgi:putative ATP-dependent endonuclease of the OLD family